MFEANNQLVELPSAVCFNRWMTKHISNVFLILYAILILKKFDVFNLNDAIYQIK